MESGPRGDPMYEAGRSGFWSLRTCWEFGWEPKFTELGEIVRTAWEWRRRRA